MLQEFEEQPCFICGGTGHRQFECPNKASDIYKLPENIQGQVDQLYQRDIARMQVCAPHLPLKHWHRPTHLSM